MSLFKYQAQSAQGVVEGVIEGTDLHSASQNLLRQGLRPFSIEPYEHKKSRSLFAGVTLRQGRLTGGDMEFFTSQLALLVKGGMSLDGALRLIAKQTEKKELRDFATRLENKLKEGLALSTALEQEPAFNTMYANIVKAGEEGGVLPEMLDNIAEYQTQARELRQFVISSSIYPLILLVAGFSILIVLFTVILPRFKMLFEGMGKELPMNVAILMAIADFMSAHLFLTFVALVSVPTLLYFYAKSARGQQNIDDLAISIPVLKGFVRDIETTRIFKTMEVLVKNGVHLVTALKISAGVATNRHYKTLLAQATVALKEGQQVAPKLHGGLFPALAVDLLAIGEESGRVGETCGQIALHFEKQLKERLKRFIALVEPAFLLIMSFGAGYIVLSMLSVILGMNDITG
ncbi:MAG: type II secretion system F family protein [Proteobacteria bacterium]|nr:type II secretion system F family protein [Pseudomonadota bacterium]MBU1639615.1 type II secretion system F family protein [Pseudomonadota bacterium]